MLSLITILACVVVGCSCAWLLLDMVQRLKQHARIEERTRENWEQTAAQYASNAEYYRGLVVRCGEAIGPAAKTTDAGEFVPDVLCAKVPELVEDMARRERART